MKNLLTYQQAIASLFRARAAADEVLEDNILAQMDHVWATMSLDERTEADRLSARIAGGELAPESLDANVAISAKDISTIRFGDVAMKNAVGIVRVIEPAEPGFGFISPIVRFVAPEPGLFDFLSKARSKAKKRTAFIGVNSSTAAVRVRG